MLLSPDLLMPTGPPPQAVLDQRWLWRVMLWLLGVTFVLRLLGLDVAGGLLSGLMLCFGVIMTRDGMQEMAKYALVYAVLCGLNFFFDILPLVTELGGRVTRTTMPGPTASDGHGTRQTSYTLTTRTTPFFDPAQGLVYNVQSAAMVLSPVCMALGVYLSVCAHSEIQRQLPASLFEDDGDEYGFGPAAAAAAAMAAGGPVHPGGRGGLGLGRSARIPAGAAGLAPPGPGRDAFERFAGRGHKLED